MLMPNPVEASGKLAQNILYFARALRAAGLPVGPGSVIDAIEAVEATGFDNRADFHAVLHAIFVKKHEHTIIFDQAFRLFWRKRGFMEKLIALMSPLAQPQDKVEAKTPAGAARIGDAFLKRPETEDLPPPQTEFDARFTMSATEILQSKDFAQMTAEEIALAKAAIAKLHLPDDEFVTRRYEIDSRGRKVDARASFRLSLRSGGATIDLVHRSARTRAAPIVAICDISGSMSEYTRHFLHFLHTIGETRQPVHVFLFGTRLTNVTRALRRKDVDEALAQCSAAVDDWSGGTRIAASLHAFNRQWARRVLGQGAIVLLFTDGLERDRLTDLAKEMDRLHRSCRKLVWLNPLLRYDAFEAKASGVRAMLPFVDEFRPIHNLKSMADLCAALSRSKSREHSFDPKQWLLRAA